MKVPFAVKALFVLAFIVGLPRVDGQCTACDSVSCISQSATSEKDYAFTTPAEYVTDTLQVNLVSDNYVKVYVVSKDEYNKYASGSSFSYYSAVSSNTATKCFSKSLDLGTDLASGPSIIVQCQSASCNFKVHFGAPDFCTELGCSTCTSADASKICGWCVSSGKCLSGSNAPAIGTCTSGWSKTAAGCSATTAAPKTTVSPTPGPNPNPSCHVCSGQKCTSETLYATNYYYYQQTHTKAMTCRVRVSSDNDMKVYSMRNSEYSKYSNSRSSSFTYYVAMSSPTSTRCFSASSTFTSVELEWGLTTVFECQSVGCKFLYEATCEEENLITAKTLLFVLIAAAVVGGGGFLYFAFVRYRIHRTIAAAHATTYAQPMVANQAPPPQQAPCTPAPYPQQQAYTQPYPVPVQGV